MKYLTSIILFFLPFIGMSQKQIEGTVFANQTPLEGAAIYFNNTMLGTTTNADGKFSITTKDGIYELVISYLGYKTIVYKLNTEFYKQPLQFYLEEEENILDEIVIKKIVYDETWQFNLTQFKNEFIGKSEFASYCTIINDKDLFFDFNAETNTLNAYTKKPLLIKNEKLGYLITYDLVKFEKNSNYISYAGYTKFSFLKGSKNKQKKWQKNRETAYLGSSTHFLKAALSNSLEKDGFIVHQFKRVPNKNRPSEQEIEKARQLIKLSGNNTKMISIKNEKFIPKNAIDSAWVVLSKVSLPKYEDFLYKSKLTANEIIGEKNGKNYLVFDDNLSVIYTKELEETNYILQNVFSKKRAPNFQNSYFIPLKKFLQVDNSGQLYNPLAVLFEGYWAFEKFAFTLPLDYEP